MEADSTINFPSPLFQTALGRAGLNGCMLSPADKKSNNSDNNSGIQMSSTGKIVVVGRGNH